VVAAIIAGYPQKLFRHATPMKAAGQRPAMPDFTLPLVNGGQWRFAEHKGNVLLVNFWATWCPPCRKETPELVELHDRYRSGGFSVVGVSLDDEPGKVVPGFVRQYRIPYPVLTPTSSFTLGEAVESLPTTLLIDRDGRVAKSYVGAVDGDEVAADVERLLSEKKGG